MTQTSREIQLIDASEQYIYFWLRMFIFFVLIMRIWLKLVQRNEP
jgi:hypothetical protein